jgi:hypothetical protein
MVRKLDELRYANRLGIRIVGVNANRGEQARVLICEGAYTRKLGKRDTDTQRVGDSCARHLGENFRDSSAEIIKVQMAVRIDEHREALLLSVVRLQGARVTKKQVFQKKPRVERVLSDARGFGKSALEAEQFREIEIARKAL